VSADTDDMGRPTIERVLVGRRQNLRRRFGIPPVHLVPVSASDRAVRTWLRISLRSSSGFTDRPPSIWSRLGSWWWRVGGDQASNDFVVLEGRRGSGVIWGRGNRGV